MSDSNPCCIRAYVSGRVQGVCYRAFTREQALAAGLTGHAINLADGRVEVLLQGLQKDVDRVLERLRSGPPRAEVRDIVVEPATPQAIQGFITG